MRASLCVHGVSTQDRDASGGRLSLVPRPAIWYAVRDDAARVAHAKEPEDADEAMAMPGRLGGAGPAREGSRPVALPAMREVVSASR